jgi:hypothetical protein
VHQTYKMNVILFILSYILLLPLTIINYFIVDNKKGYFKSTAINIDRFANREFRAMFNKFFKTPEGYLFGDERETISSALGKNQRDNTLTRAGRALCAILDFLDKNHCKNSINNNL